MRTLLSARPCGHSGVNERRPCARIILAPSAPERPNVRFLKDQARRLVRSGAASTLAGAQFRLARDYGFSSWPQLKEHVESRQHGQETADLKQAIDTNDLAAVQRLMTRNPRLHRAAMGYGNNGPLTWVAECRVPWEPPGPARLAMAQWMIEHGSDVHQGGDGPLMRAALVGMRVPMMELLVAHGADVNAHWANRFPIIFAPCETVEPVPLRWLLEHGADPVPRGSHIRDTALDYVIGTYSRSPNLAACIDLLLDYGCPTRRGEPAVLALLRGRLDTFAGLLDADPALLHRRFPELDFGNSGSRRLTLRGATLLHVAAEYGLTEAARLLLARGADVNARAAIDTAGVGGQTPLFHAASQFYDGGLAMVQLLLDGGADPNVRARLPGHYERPEEFVEATPLGYALLFPGTEGATVRLLREHEAGV